VTNGSERVCPECGASAGEAPFCANCGRNLTKEDRLPSREEWGRDRLVGAAAEVHKDAPASEAPSEQSAGSRRGLWIVLGIVLLGAIGIAVAVIANGSGSNHRTETFTIPSEAMEPTIAVDSKVSVDLDAYKKTAPAIGDIVIFNPPQGANGSGAGGECGNPRTGAGGRSGAACDEPTPSRASVVFIKRIVAGPGDTLSIENGHPVVNGRVAQEDFVRPCTPGGACNLPKAITIPPDHYFLMGDNRGSSDDSRFWGPVPKEWLLGKVTDH
jgi:signal peptidase I